MNADLDARHRPDDICPACAAAAVHVGLTTEAGIHIDLCSACGARWEREARENPLAERCDNCAFRPGSPEQRDPDKWFHIVENTLEGSGTFHCHKRVPMEATETGFRFLHQVENGRCTNATECAGWLAAKLKRLEKQP